MRLALIRRFLAQRPGYQVLQATRPQTLAYTLTDSVNHQVIRFWRRSRDGLFPGGPGGRFCDRVLGASLTLGSCSRIWRTLSWIGWSGSTTCCGWFPHDIVLPVRTLAERAYKITYWTEFDRSGHFSAIEVPDLLAGDIQAFFSDLH